MAGFSLFTFLMALGGLVVHFTSSWGEFWRAKETARLGPIAYMKRDPPMWIASTVGTILFYFALPEAAEMFKMGGTHVTPGWSLLAGYVGSSMGAKALSFVAARVGIR